MVAGKEVTPKDAADTERLKTYWAEGAGAARVGWGIPGDFDRCVALVTPYMGPKMAPGYCAELHKRATGATPGHAPGAEQADYEAKHHGKP